MAILSKINLKNTFGSIKERIKDFFSKTSKKRLAVVFALVLVLFLVPFYPAQAGFLEDLVTTALFFGPYILIWLFTGLAVIFVYIATFLVDAALAPGIYMGIINSAAIDRGWTIMRDTANLFFILILIFIAIATTLRLQSYSAKTWIPKLLFGAVFINFSKTITMFIIDIGNMFMYGAISWMGQGIENTGIWQLTNTVNELFWHVSPFQWQLITITKMVEVFTAFMFSLILALTLLGFGILLLVRVTMLAILTIFSPIAFMLHAWPNAGKYAGQWWGSLLKYIIFGPIIVFFLFIAGEMALTLFNMGAFAVAPTGTVGPTTGDMSKMSVELGAFSTFFGTLIPFVIVIIILLSGLSFTTEMGIAGAGMIMGTVKGLAAGGGAIVGGLAAKQVLNKGIRGFGWAKGGWKNAKEGYRTGGVKGGLGSLGRGLKQTAKGAPRQFWDGTKDTVATPFRGVTDAYSMFKNQKDRKEIDFEKKKMEMLNKNSDDMRKEMSSSTLSPAERAARMERMAEKGDLTEDDKKYLNMATALGTNINKKLIGDAMPSWSGELKGKKGSDADKEVESKVAELIDNGKIRNINPGDWNKVYAQVEKQLDPAEFDRIINNSSKKTKENIQTAIDNMITSEHAKFRANHAEGHDQFNYNLADTRGYNNFNRKSRLALLKQEDLQGTFRNNMGMTDAGAIQNFAAYNYKDLDKFHKQPDLELVADYIDENTLARIRSQDLNPAKAKVIGNRILATRAGSAEATYVTNNAMWRP